jgi:hypothetical protein
VLALPQFRHTSPQLVERQKLFLIGGQQAVDAFAGSKPTPSAAVKSDGESSREASPVPLSFCDRRAAL